MSAHFGPNGLVEITRDLIRIPTINPPGPNHRVFAEYVENVLRLMGLEVDTLESTPDSPIVVAWLNRGAKPELHFNGHYDVVPPGAGWTVPPFEGIIADGRIYGRGSADMKGGIASILGAVDNVIHSVVPMKGCLSISLVPDEEVGGANGSGKLVESGLIWPDWVVIPEPTFPRILLGHKGVVQLEITVPGQSAHAAMPMKGQNAFEGMIKIAQAIVQHWDVRNGIVEASEPGLSINEPVLLPTLVLGGIVTSGYAPNVVPAECVFSADWRFGPSKTAAQVRDEFESFIFSQNASVEVRRKLEIDASLIGHDEASSLLGALQAIISNTRGESAPELISYGYMDSHFFRAKWGIPAIGYGPGDSTSAHVADESISVQNIWQVSTIFASLITALLGQ